MPKLPTIYHGAFTERRDLEAILGNELPANAEVTFAWCTVTGRGTIDGGAQRQLMTAYWVVPITEYNNKAFGATGWRVTEQAGYDSGWTVELSERTSVLEEDLRSFRTMPAEKGHPGAPPPMFTKKLLRAIEEAYLYMIHKRDKPTEGFIHRGSKRLSGLSFEKPGVN